MSADTGLRAWAREEEGGGYLNYSPHMIMIPISRTARADVRETMRSTDFADRHAYHFTLLSERFFTLLLAVFRLAEAIPLSCAPASNAGRSFSHTGRSDP